MSEKILNPQEFKEKMEEIYAKYKDDPEAFWSLSSDLMCEILNSLGYQEGIKIYQKISQ